LLTLFFNFKEMEQIFKLIAKKINQLREIKGFSQKEIC
jgi:hypothetical protein